MLKWLNRLVMMLLMLALVQEAQAQRTRKRPPKETNKQTPESAQKREGEKKAELIGQYEVSKDDHYDRQDKATQKRMKQNLKKAERYSQGRRLPWYKRLFRKR